MKKLATIYAIRDKSTGNLVSGLTNHSNKLWVQRRWAESAIKNYDNSWRNIRKENLEVVTLHCYDEEIPDPVIGIIDAVISLKNEGYNFNEMTDFTPDQERAYQKHIEEISQPVIGADGRPINVLDMDKPPADSRFIPKKPLPENKYYGNGICPHCGVYFLDKSTKYCGNCGQALDWSE
jgi:hypothetical protein